MMIDDRLSSSALSWTEALFEIYRQLHPAQLLA
jgi:hypothetical protein